MNLVVYNSVEQIIETLVSHEQQAGTYLVEFSNPALRPGAYMFRLFLQGESGDYTQSGTMIKMPE